MTSYSAKTRRVFLEDSGIPNWDNEARIMNLDNRKHIKVLCTSMGTIILKMTESSRMSRKTKRAFKEEVSRDLLLELLREIHNEGQ